MYEVYIYSINVPPIMIINRIQSSVVIACFLPGRAKGLSAPLNCLYVLFGRTINTLLRNRQPADVTQDCLFHFFGSVTLVIQKSRKPLRFWTVTVESPKYGCIQNERCLMLTAGLVVSRQVPAPVVLAHSNRHIYPIFLS